MVNQPTLFSQGKCLSKGQVLPFTTGETGHAGEVLIQLQKGVRVE